MRHIGLILAVLWPSVALAGPSLPEALQKRVASDPAAYVEAAAALIAGYGTEGAIDAAGIARMASVARAKGRARAMAGLMAADLDADGAIDAEEVAAASVDLSATARGRLVVQVAKADGDGDGVVSAGELAGFGAAAGMAAFGANKLADLQALLGLDSDGDGKVRLDEVKAGLAALGLSA